MRITLAANLNDTANQQRFPLTLSYFCSKKSESTLKLAQAMGLLQLSDGAYCVEPELVQRAALGPAPLPVMLAMMRALPGHLRSSQALMRTAQDRGMVYHSATKGLGRMLSDTAALLADKLRPATQILDVGAGSGVWSLAMARRHPGTQVTALDLEPVLPVFREHAEGVNPPAHTVAGDYHQVELPPTFDRIVLGNVLHLEPEGSARALLSRARNWLAPGGELLVIDALFDNEKSRLGRAAYALHLGLRVQGGRVYEAEQLESWAKDLGLTWSQRLELDSGRGFGALLLRESR